MKLVRIERLDVGNKRELTTGGQTGDKVTTTTQNYRSHPDLVNRKK
jgi:hypothetical protein